MAGTKVLVVEDEENIASLISDILELHNATALLASTGTQARRIMTDARVEFAIVDITLPDMSGLELCDQLYETHPELKGRVIFMSGMEPLGEVEHHMNRTGNQFIQKPFHLQEFRTMLDSWLD